MCTKFGNKFVVALENFQLYTPSVPTSSSTTGSPLDPYQGCQRKSRLPGPAKSRPCRGDLLRSVPWPIFEKNSEFLLFDVYSFVFHWLLGSMWWKNTFPSSAIFSLNFLPIFTCLVSGHDNWHFLRIIWSGHFE